MDRAALAAWVSGYEEAWRAPGTARLAALFAPDVTYVFDPYLDPIRGLATLEGWWEAERDGPDEVFSMTSEVVAVDGDVGVVRVEVGYGEPVRQEFRDLWIVRVDGSGRCVAFEEWPFWPGHGRSPSVQTAPPP